MSLIQALSTAMAGLNAAQAGLTVTAGNVANAETAAGNAVGVDVLGVNRQLDQIIINQLRTETSGGSFADTTAQLYQQLQQAYGTPGSAGTFDKTFNDFTTAMQALV